MEWLLAGAQAQKPGREAFHGAMVTITVTHSDTCLGAALALGKENRKWYVGAKCLQSWLLSSIQAVLRVAFR